MPKQALARLPFCLALCLATMWAPSAEALVIEVFEAKARSWNKKKLLEV